VCDAAVRICVELPLVVCVMLLHPPATEHTATHRVCDAAVRICVELQRIVCVMLLYASA
jgi:hypothetical protein